MSFEHAPTEPVVRITAVGGRLRVEAIRPSATTLVERTVGIITWRPTLVCEHNRGSIMLNLPPDEGELLSSMVADAAREARGQGPGQSIPDHPPETTPDRGETP